MQSKINAFFSGIISIKNTKHKKIDINGNTNNNEPNKKNIYNMNNNYVMYFDGASKGNPGNAGCGAVIYEINGENKKEIWSGSRFVGNKETNNVAEYMGLIFGLENAVRMGIIKLDVKGDSMLVIQQLSGKYKVKNPKMIQLFAEAKQHEKNFVTITYEHVYRDENKRADELSNVFL